MEFRHNANAGLFYANYKLMKIFLIGLYLIGTTSIFGQSNPSRQNGTYFKTTSSEYFEKVIKPWKYQYTQTQVENDSDSVQKIGKIIFWRSEAIYDKISKKYWKPDISYDIYSDSTYARNLAVKIKSLSSCAPLNKGGDILFVGHFILVSTSICVNCASSSNIDYCRNIINRIFESVPNKDTNDWNELLKQFIIDKAKFTP